MTDSFERLVNEAPDDQDREEQGEYQEANFFRSHNNSLFEQVHSILPQFSRMCVRSLIFVMLRTVPSSLHRPNLFAL